MVEAGGGKPAACCARRKLLISRSHQKPQTALNPRSGHVSGAWESELPSLCRYGPVAGISWSSSLGGAVSVTRARRKVAVCASGTRTVPRTGCYPQIDKWNGQLPTVQTGQGGGMILQLPKPQ